jgi:predicted nucleic acid-binding protein
VADSELLVDTSIIIDHFRKKDKRSTVFYRISSGYTLHISAITEYELYVGAQNDESEVFLGTLISRCDVVPLSSETARLSAKLYRTLRSQNRLISINDIFIAATALQYGLTLVTLNLKEFGRIQSLQLFG